MLIKQKSLKSHQLLNGTVLAADGPLKRHVTFQRVEEGLSLGTQEGGAVVPVVFGVVIHGGVTA